MFVVPESAGIHRWNPNAGCRPVLEAFDAKTGKELWSWQNNQGGPDQGASR